MDACMHAAAWTSGHNKWMLQKPFSPGLTHARWGSTVLTGHVTARDVPMLRPPHVSDTTSEHSTCESSFLGTKKLSDSSFRAAPPCQTRRCNHFKH